MNLRGLGLAITVALVVGASMAASCATGQDPDARGPGGAGGLDAASDGSAATTSSGGSATGGSAGGGAGGTDASSTGGSSSGGTGTGGAVADARPWDVIPDIQFTYDGSQPDRFDPDATCAETVVRAEATPLDLHVMLDQSASMYGKTPSGVTKWDAVKQALTGFINHAQSEGIGVGIQYFPLRKSGVPAVCTSNAECGTSGPCFLKTCSASANFVPCTADSQCRPGICVDLGECSNDLSYICRNVGGTCGGTIGGPCVKKAGFCVLEGSCDLSQYTTPAVPIGLLPGNAAALVTSINAQTPFGYTPTGPALQGAVNYARTFAQANPTHSVAIVLATDGLPTECTPTNINQIANIAAGAASGSPSIKTFVIGVFAATDTGAQTNLNAIASGGGTAPAYLVDSGGNVAQGFIDALNQIRGKTLGCEFQMPKPEAGVVDPTEVQVKYTPSSGTVQVLPNVSGSGACSGDQWYYDNGANPTKITLCPALCTKVKAETNPQIDISLGCLGT
jgi:Mg-chelatase subunit ChlD